MGCAISSEPSPDRPPVTPGTPTIPDYLAGALGAFGALPPTSHGTHQLRNRAEPLGLSLMHINIPSLGLPSQLDCRLALRLEGQRVVDVGLHLFRAGDPHGDPFPGVLVQANGGQFGGILPRQGAEQHTFAVQADGLSDQSGISCKKCQRAAPRAFPKGRSGML